MFIPARGSEPSMIVLDDHMSDINQVVADIFTKISHHRNINILHLTQNLFHKNRHMRTISLNSHYLVLIKNHRDAGQFSILARQMYPSSWKFAEEAYRDASSIRGVYHTLETRPYSTYLLSWNRSSSARGASAFRSHVSVT